jgi:cation diffusion facilitator CzcD-associated flavoprotein CzcO
VRTVENVYDLDVIVLALGFDSFTGALLHLGITGRNGLSLEEAWGKGPRTYLGLASHGFPNLFMIAGPQSPAPLTNGFMARRIHQRCHCPHLHPGVVYDRTKRGGLTAVV